jgi:hypothetical protein
MPRRSPDRLADLREVASRDPSSRGLPGVIVGLLALASALATIAYVAHAFLFSSQSPVAAEIGFEALRVARRLPLYVDPWKGAWEDGAPPSRYYVLYTPVFPWIVGKASALVSSTPSLATVRSVGRTIAVLSWIAAQSVPVALAPRDRRRATAIATMIGAGIYFVARHAASMSPDTLATALVVIGVARAARKDAFDPLSAALVVAAPFVKPSCIGGIAGAAFVHLALRRPGWIRALAVAAATALGLAALSHLASDGQWLANITRSTGQPLTLARWAQELGSRVMVLGLPHAFVAWLAWRRRATWIVVGPLLGSVCWATFAMAKHGSGAHYWLEPTALAVIAISRLPAAPPGERVARLLPWAAALFAVLVVAVSWPQYLREPARYRRRAEAVAAIDQHCVRGEGQFVVSSDLDLELALNGRISVPSWQTGFLARTGRFPADAWREDLARPEVRWVAVALDPRLPPGTSNDERVELSPFYDVLEPTLLEHFAFDANVGGFFVFKRR